MISYQGFLKLKCPVWVPVRAQQNGHGIVWVAAATDHSLGPGLCACTRVSCAPLLARCSNFEPPVAEIKEWFIAAAPRRSHAHFAEREQEPTPGISILRILGMGSHTKIPGWPRSHDWIRNALLQIGLIQRTYSVERWLLTDVNGHVIATELVYLKRRARSICLSYL